MNYKTFFLLIVIFSCYLYSAEPLLKFYLQDGSSKQYNLSEIDNMKFPNAPETLQLQVFKNNGKSLYYPAQLIDSIKFAFDYANENRLHIWHDGFIWNIAIHEIDSILLYYTSFPAVTIGAQHWMYRNLDVDHYRNGDSIPEVRDSATWANLKTGAWCYYNNDPSLSAIYGKLYNWYAVNDPRGLEPSGYHIPSDSEWTVLTTYLGGEYVAGGKLKSTGTIESGNGLWYSLNTGATNESGFSALPGGRRNDISNYKIIGYFGYWWSATESYSHEALYRNLTWQSSFIYDFTGPKKFGCSVRCIKD